MANRPTGNTDTQPSASLADGACALGLGLYWAWGICVAIGEHPVGLVRHAFPSDPLVFNVLVKLAVCILLLALFNRKAHLIASRQAFLALATLIVATPLLNELPFLIARIAGNIASAAANILLLLRWLLGIKTTTPRTYSALLGSVPLCFATVLLVQSLPRPFSEMVAYVLPLASLGIQHVVYTGAQATLAAATATGTRHEWRGWTRLWPLVAMCLATALPLSYYKYAFDLSKGSPEWNYVMPFSLVVSILACLISMILARRQAKSAHVYPLPLMLLFLGVLLVSVLVEPRRTIAIGTLVYSGDYLCRAYLYEAALAASTGARDVLIRGGAATASILAGHLVGMGLGRVASAAGTNLVTTACVCALLFGACLLALPHLWSKPARDEAPSVPQSPLDAIDRAYRELGKQAALDYALTDREVDVYVLLLQGMNAQLIARYLGVSTSTVKSHMDRIYKKAGIHTREELVSRALGL